MAHDQVRGDGPLKPGPTLIALLTLLEIARVSRLIRSSLSHGPAVSQLASLLDGVSPGHLAIPADLHRPSHERPAWEVSWAQLAAIHRQLLALLDAASDEHSLDPTALVELVVKIGTERKSWFERLDWKAFVQAIRVHTIEHENQLKKTVPHTLAG